MALYKVINLWTFINGLTFITALLPNGWINIGQWDFSQLANPKCVLINGLLPIHIH